MKAPLILASTLFVAAGLVFPAESPEAKASISVGGKTISIDYCAPSVRGRKIFGDGGQISHDPNYPIWRAGANSATAFHTDADLQVGSLQVPKGDYTLYVNLADPSQWELVINKQTGQWGLTYNKERDLGRVKMNMSKPSAPVETLKYTLSKESSNKVKLQLAWDDHVASVPITVK